jgi:hypothetical protein
MWSIERPLLKKILNNLKITIKIKVKKRIFFDLKTHRLCELQC